jgi:uncharacterized protein DUF3592
MAPHAHTIFSAAFLVVGAGTAVHGLWTLYVAWGSEDWPSVQGAILDTSLETSSDSDGRTTYAPRVRYTYEVTGKTYTSDRLFIGGPLYTSWRSPALTTTERYRPGSSCSVRYDPSQPIRSCLEPGAKWYLFLVPLVGALFAALGVLSLLDRIDLFT